MEPAAGQERSRELGAPGAQVARAQFGRAQVGGDGFQDMELFGKSKRQWLEQFLDLPHGIPSHDTFGRVFARLDPVVLRSKWASRDKIGSHPQKTGCKVLNFSGLQDIWFTSVIENEIPKLTSA